MARTRTIVGIALAACIVATGGYYLLLQHGGEFGFVKKLDGEERSDSTSKSTGKDRYFAFTQNTSAVLESMKSDLLEHGWTMLFSDETGTVFRKQYPDGPRYARFYPESDRHIPQTCVVSIPDQPAGLIDSWIRRFTRSDASKLPQVGQLIDVEPQTFEIKADASAKVPTVTATWRNLTDSPMPVSLRDVYLDGYESVPEERVTMSVPPWSKARRTFVFPSCPTVFDPLDIGYIGQIPGSGLSAMAAALGGLSHEVPQADLQFPGSIETDVLLRGRPNRSLELRDIQVRHNRLLVRSVTGPITLKPGAEMKLAFPFRSDDFVVVGWARLSPNKRWRRFQEAADLRVALRFNEIGHSTASRRWFSQFLGLRNGSLSANVLY